MSTMTSQNFASHTEPNVQYHEDKEGCNYYKFREK